VSFSGAGPISPVTNETFLISAGETMERVSGGESGDRDDDKTLRSRLNGITGGGGGNRSYPRIAEPRVARDEYGIEELLSAGPGGLAMIEARREHILSLVIALASVALVGL